MLWHTQGCENSTRAGWAWFKRNGSERYQLLPVYTVKYTIMYTILCDKTVCDVGLYSCMLPAGLRVWSLVAEAQIDDDHIAVYWWLWRWLGL